MAFPPKFSSTETYANRYDLDEIDVFLEGNSNNPMFFNVGGLPNQLAFGKHYFNISILDSINQQYELRSNSKILFEFKSKNNVVIKSDVSDINQRNGAALCFVELLQDPKRTFKEIQDGEGTLTIVGSLQNKQNTQNLIPDKFLNAMNYRCVFPIDIRKNLINADSPISLQSKHETKTALGRFSFRTAAITTRFGSEKGTTYDSDGFAKSPLGPPKSGGS